MSRIPANLAADYHRGERPTAPAPRSLTRGRLAIATLICFAVGIAISFALDTTFLRSHF